MHKPEPEKDLGIFIWCEEDPEMLGHEISATEGGVCPPLFLPAIDKDFACFLLLVYKHMC